jgi:hypothetical protein
MAFQGKAITPPQNSRVVNGQSKKSLGGSYGTNMPIGNRKGPVGKKSSRRGR